MPETLFCRRSLSTGSDLNQLVRKRVLAVAEDALLDLPVPVTVDQLLNELASPELEVHWEDVYTEGVKETTVDHQRYDGMSIELPGARIDIRVPFDGDGELFDVQPSSHTLNPPRADVDRQSMELVLSLTDREISTGTVTAFVERQRQAISQYVLWVNADVRQQRTQLEQLLTDEVTARRGRLLAGRGVEAAIGIPIRPAGSTSTYPLPVRATRLRLTEKAGRHPYRPEPELDLLVYEDVLSRISGFRATLERSPGTFVHLGEEDLRNHLLLILNANYEGAATAETFNGSGKTDILLRHENRNVFIAECKFWHGSSAFTAAIDQLLGYLVWRDSKAALILFIREKNPTAIIEKAISALRNHPRYVSGAAGTDPSDRSDFFLRSTEEGDSVRTLRMALIPVVVPAAAATPLEKRDPSAG